MFLMLIKFSYISVYSRKRKIGYIYLETNGTIEVYMK